MAISYSTATEPKQVIEAILEEILFDNKTISQGYVTFNDNIKAVTIITEESMVVTAQLYRNLSMFLCLHC